MSTTILLGAGASVDAGIPSAVPLTGAVAAQVRRDLHVDTEVIDALNLAFEAMSEVRNGELDIEEFFSAIQMLARPQDFELAPFVAQWAEGVAPLLERPRLYPGTNDQTLGASAFARLEQAVIRALRKTLVESQGEVDYLQPLLDFREGRAPLHVVTLNYDLTVETMVRAAGLTVDTGVDDSPSLEGNAWEGGFEWTWRGVEGRSADVRLLKLHGSVDWLLSSPTWPPKHQGDLARRMKVRGLLQDDLVDRQFGPKGRTSPAMIFGKRGKLRSEGPYLAMLLEFRHILQSTDHLFIAGYSMRDDHVNDPIRDWFNAAAIPRVTFVDPGWVGSNPAAVLQDAVQSGFVSSLFRGMSDEARATQQAFVLDESRHRIVPQTLASALSRA